MTESRRVALLARPGEACERMRAALVDAGATVVLEGDPVALQPAALGKAAPDVVLVVLDGASEDALDRFDSVLADPAIEVIFEEADLALARQGWDAARWVRHLSAKLHRHDNVLPPGREAETDVTLQRYAGFEVLQDEPAHAVPVSSHEIEEVEADFGTEPLALELDDDPTTADSTVGAPVEETAEARGRFQHDLDDLHQRIASMQLVDGPVVRGPEQARGVVLVLAGIGGPDAVRQLLGALPEHFARPVLVQQRLDGGRYDKLVAQMQRATALPVQLAEPGARAAGGSIYILPADVALQADDNGVSFIAGNPNDPGAVLAALPAADSAVLLLSGSDPTLVDAAMNHSWAGALVLAQNPEGCYDAIAPQLLISRGGNAGTPLELAKQLTERWR